MRIQDKCIPCIVNQAIKVAVMAGLEDKNELLRKVFTYLSQADFNASSTPELIGDIFRLLKKETGNEDPYKETRLHYNKMFLEQIPDFEQEINGAEHPFLEAVKYAIIGNVIDFNPIHNLMLSDVEASFLTLKEEQLEINDSNLLMHEIMNAHTVLYLGDNCGEICLDKIFIKKIKELNPSCHVFYGTRGEPVVNDSVEEDAYFVGIDEYATVISNGDSSMGTVLYRTSERFQEIYRNADVVIAKGQANYESLSNENKNIYFLLMTKCSVIANDIGVPEMKMICLKQNIKPRGSYAIMGAVKMAESPTTISVREHPEFFDRAVEYFSSKWGIDRKVYEESISDGITTSNPLPRWYLMLDNERIIGSYGLIENDFMVRKDLLPWLCALYVEESERGKALGSKLLAHGREETKKLGFDKLYLCTDHVGYYEKYGWHFFGMEESEWGGDTRVYWADC